MKIREIYEYLDKIAPIDLAFEWDNSGFLIGDIEQDLKKALICLDITDEIVNEAIDKSCNLIISHHPVIFHALKKITSDMLVHKIIKNDINVISLHTNLDLSNNGVNKVLASILELVKLSPFKIEYERFHYKLVVFVPNGYENGVKKAILDAGGGVQGNYSECIFESEGIGSFKPGNEATPFIGKEDAVERVSELRIESIVPKNKINRVITKMIESHPYEEPAYDLIKIYSNSDKFSLGLTGELQREYNVDEFADFVKGKLNSKQLNYVSGNRNIRKVAVCGGAGSDLVKKAIECNVDAYITSEIKHNIWYEAKKSGLTLMDAGHFSTENIVVYELVNMLRNKFGRTRFYVADNNINIVETI